MKTLNVIPARTACINNLYYVCFLFVVYRKSARCKVEDVVPVQRPIMPHVLQCLVLFSPAKKKKVTLG